MLRRCNRINRIQCSFFVVCLDLAIAHVHSDRLITYQCKARVVVAWLASFLMEFYTDQTHGAPEDLKLMAECTCLV